ncbi:hypothetical protein SAMN05421813_108132 [Daejeonella rubra]|uniref:MG2 domain-containing protein n=1 Tax=Daejeonella rubra TaxID=990371 RepID=A0A1G9RSC6_9SPHI|nr:hypothetical protein [Daejeonella rubra]SDM26062.1 hypothetical protein SAMN05421813_108132 [Daejeonella rubra]
MRTALACFLGFILFGTVYAQTSMTDSLVVHKFELHSRSNPSNPLFVHTDKTIYTNNETVWFSAYLIESGKTYLHRHTILSLAMVREDNREIILQDKYLMKDGLSFGSMGLPDSIPPGNYMFIASTNVLDKNGQPLTVFTQPLTIKSIVLNSFNATLSLLDSVVTGGAVRSKLTLTPKEPDPKSKIKPGITYSVGKGEKQTVVLKQNESTYIMTIPASQVNQTNPILLTTITYNEEVGYLSIKLPEHTVSGMDVQFFPEGGNLVNGLTGTIAWEAKNRQNVPIALKGILYRNDIPLDTISTNSYGIGSFKLRPDHEGIYTLKVSANNYLEKDTVFTLPRALEDGIILQLNNAIVNDTLKFSLFSKSPKNIKVLIHNYRKVFGIAEVQAKAIGTKVIMALPELPKGIATITILDENGRPSAERLFFAHHDQKIIGDIQTDKAVYKRKEKVNVKLKLTDQNGKPVQGIMSAAVVQDNRIESSKQQDIESYVYLNHDLGGLPKDPAGRGLDNKDYLEDIMLVKGWRRFTWQNLIQTGAKDTLVIQTPKMTGRVTYNNKDLKKPVQISLFRDSLFELLTTDTDGSFIINENQLVTTEGRKVLASVNEKNKTGFAIETDNPFKNINQRLSDQFVIQNTNVAPAIQNSSDQQLKGMERMIALQEVVVTGNKNDYSLYGMKGAGPNACGDYVCSFGILNCSNHVGGRAPIKGERFGNGFVYSGCILDESNETKTIFKINPVFTSREFYGVNTDSAGLIEAQFISTLFWQPGLMNNEKGETEFSFITGDITGKFRIIIQGVGIENMIFGEQSFTVK